MDWTKQIFDYAKKRMDEGMDASNFFLVMPLPGSKLFDYAVDNGHMEKDFDPDRMHWQKANMKNTLVPAHELEKIRDEQKFDSLKSLGNQLGIDENSCLKLIPKYR